MGPRQKSSILRRNLTLSSDCIATIAKLRDSLGATSESEVVRRSVRLLHLLHTESTGSEIVIRNKKTGKEKLVLII